MGLPSGARHSWRANAVTSRLPALARSTPTTLKRCNAPRRERRALLPRHSGLSRETDLVSAPRTSATRSPRTKSSVEQAAVALTWRRVRRISVEDIAEVVAPERAFSADKTSIGREDLSERFHVDVERLTDTTRHPPSRVVDEGHSALVGAELPVERWISSSRHAPRRVQPCASNSKKRRRFSVIGRRPGPFGTRRDDIREHLSDRFRCDDHWKPPRRFGRSSTVADTPHRSSRPPVRLREPRLSRVGAPHSSMRPPTRQGSQCWRSGWP